MRIFVRLRIIFRVLINDEEMYKIDGYSRHHHQHGATIMMHKEKMKQKYDLEDYIYDVESRSLENEADPNDLYAQLQQKEKDLILAAELGKALLEKNEDLSRHNERLAEEYSQKLEVSSFHSIKKKNYYYYSYIV